MPTIGFCATLDAARLDGVVANEHDAEDAVQEACLRALRYFGTFSGVNGRAWFLQIVRNTCYRWYGRAQPLAIDVFNEDQHSAQTPASDPETLTLTTSSAYDVPLCPDQLGMSNRSLRGVSPSPRVRESVPPPIKPMPSGSHDRSRDLGPTRRDERFDSVTSGRNQ